MLSNSRFFIRTLLIVLSFTATWIVLTASAAIEGRDDQKLNSGCKPRREIGDLRRGVGGLGASLFGFDFAALHQLPHRD